MEPAAPTPDAAITGMIDTVLVMLTDAFGPLGPIYAFAAVAALTIAAAAPLLLSKKVDPLDRLARPVIDLKHRKTVHGVPEKLRTESGGSRLAPIAGYLEPKDEKELTEIRLKLVQAGYRGNGAVRTFYFARAVGAGGLTLLAAMYLTFALEEVSLSRYLMIAGLALAVGYLAPNYWVTRRRQERQTEISNGFPDALDLMLICVEAGQSLDQSLMRVATEIRHAHPVLADEFQIVSAEMRAGKDRALVLRDFAKRAGVNDVASFVTVLVQSASFGTSVADALRIYAAEMRDKRLMRAEEKANVLPTKLTLCTMFFTVPPLMLILIGPSLIDIVNTMSHF
ncbi:MAG: tight adherence protein C [Paracoccaceae bacterium]|jgi:tight adherence protein C